jgi:hypothetical protein
MFGGDPDYFQELTEALRKRLKEAGAVEVRDLNAANIYLWLPLSKRKISPDERKGLAAWLDRGGTRREIHFHWAEGSVDPDGLRARCSAALDRIYQNALDIDYAALSAEQDPPSSCCARATCTCARPPEPISVSAWAIVR